MESYTSVALERHHVNKKDGMEPPPMPEWDVKAARKSAAGSRRSTHSRETCTDCADPGGFQGAGKFGTIAHSWTEPPFHSIMLKEKTMSENRPSGYEYRSFFWPLVLIGIGVLFLLSNMGVIEPVSLGTILRFWPVILIVIGLDLVFGRRSPWLGALIGLAAVALVFALIIATPALGLPPSFELKTERFTEPLGAARSATIDLNLAEYSTTVSALSDSDALFDAELTYTGRIDFEARGDAEKTISLRKTSEGFNFDWLDAFDTSKARWEIGLSPEVPMDLKIDVGSGSAKLDLSELNIVDLEIDGGSGSSELTLPATGSRYPVAIRGGSGSVRMEIPSEAELEGSVDTGSGSANLTIGSGADVKLDWESGSGSVNIRVPADAAIRVNVVDTGSGSVNLPSWLDLVDDGNDNDDETGIWETEDFDRAKSRIEITIDSASGSFNIG